MHATARQRSHFGGGLLCTAQRDSRPACMPHKSHSGGSTLATRCCCSRLSRSSRNLQKACRPSRLTPGCAPSRRACGLCRASTATLTTRITPRPTPQARTTTMVVVQTMMVPPLEPCCPSPHARTTTMVVVVQSSLNATFSSGCSTTMRRTRRRWRRPSRPLRAFSPPHALRHRQTRQRPTTRQGTRRRHVCSHGRCIHRWLARSLWRVSWCSPATDQSTCCSRFARSPRRTTDRLRCSSSTTVPCPSSPCSAVSTLASSWSTLNSPLVSRHGRITRGWWCDWSSLHAVPPLARSAPWLPGWRRARWCCTGTTMTSLSRDG